MLIKVLSLFQRRIEDQRRTIQSLHWAKSSSKPNWEKSFSLVLIILPKYKYRENFKLCEMKV